MFKGQGIKAAPFMNLYILSRWGRVWRGKTRLCWKANGVQEPHWHIPVHLWTRVSAKTGRRRLSRWGKPQQRGFEWVGSDKGRKGHGLCPCGCCLLLGQSHPASLTSYHDFPCRPPCLLIIYEFHQQHHFSLSWPLSAFPGPFAARSRRPGISSRPFLYCLHSFAVLGSVLPITSECLPTGLALLLPP